VLRFTFSDLERSRVRPAVLGTAGPLDHWSLMQINLRRIISRARAGTFAC
jgi:hypothetical protein